MSGASWSGYDGPQVPFRRVFQKVDRSVPPNAGIVTAYTDGQVTLRTNRSKVGYHEAADLSGFQGVKPGDFVVHGLDILRGSVGVSDSQGAISNVCTVCRPRGVDGRFMAYVMRLQAQSGLTRAMARGVREGGADFRRWDTLADLPLPLVPLDEQRRIAEFLDERVALIDRIIEARRAQVTHLDEWAASGIETALSPIPTKGRWVRVKDVTSHVGSGKTPRGGADAYVEAGVTFLRSQNVHNDGLHLDEVAYIPPETDAEMRATRVRAGDVLLNITGGSLGRCCAVSDTSLPANVSQHVCILRPRGISAWKLAIAITSLGVQDQIRLSQVGGNREGLNFEQVKDLRFWLPEDDSLWEIAHRTRGAATRAVSQLRQAIVLLTEYKQSLITAAVTGELDVTTASTRLPYNLGE